MSETIFSLTLLSQVSISLGFHTILFVLVQFIVNKINILLKETKYSNFLLFKQSGILNIIKIMMIIDLSYNIDLYLDINIPKVFFSIASNQISVNIYLFCYF